MNKYLVFLFIITLASCGSIEKTFTTRTKDIQGIGVIQKPVLADLEVKEVKVSGTAMGHKRDGMESVKLAALKDALDKSSADVLVEPRYDTERKGKKITATVKGWPANYKNFRNVQKEDIELLKAGKAKYLGTDSPAEEKKQKSAKGSLGAKLGVSGGVLLALILILAL